MIIKPQFTTLNNMVDCIDMERDDVFIQLTFNYDNLEYKEEYFFEQFSIIYTNKDNNIIDILLRYNKPITDKSTILSLFVIIEDVECARNIYKFNIQPDTDLFKKVFKLNNVINIFDRHYMIRLSGVNNIHNTLESISRNSIYQNKYLCKDFTLFKDALGNDRFAYIFPKECHLFENCDNNKYIISNLYKNSKEDISYYCDILKLTEEGLKDLETNFIKLT